MERIKKHYIPLLILVLIASFLFFLNKGQKNTIVYITWSSAYISIALLTVSLVIGPVNLMLKRRNPVSTYLRRDISLTGGILAIIHSVAGLFVHLRGKTWLYFLNKTDEGYVIRTDDFGIANNTGLISALIIILLIITSNDYFLKKIEPDRWKNLQRSSYLMFLLALVHCYFYYAGRKNQENIYFFYLPVLVCVIVFQVWGVRLHSLRNKQLKT
jgi:sulfoxide reductase heme-binding subunit YedZ